MNERSQQIIANLTVDIKNKFHDQQAYIQTLSQLIQQYESAAVDLIQLKTKYVEIVRQYSETNDFKPAPSTFPGVITAAPPFSNDKMQADSKQLTEMGTVLNDLENQVQLIYAQLRRTLTAIVTLTTSASSMVEQTSIFLSQSIADVSGNGVYGSSTLKDLNM